jgi:hypothetical protein
MTKVSGIKKPSSRLIKTHGATREAGRPAKLTAAEQCGMILSMFFDEDGDADGFIALVNHCGIDLAACHGDVKQLPKLIAAHYRLQRGTYDIDRAARDLATFPPIAARIEELMARRATRTAKR